VQIIRHLAKCFEDDGVAEFAEIEVAPAREDDDARVGLIVRHNLRAPNRGGAVRAFDRLSRRESAFDALKGNAT